MKGTCWDLGLPGMIGFFLEGRQDGPPSELESGLLNSMGKEVVSLLALSQLLASLVQSRVQQQMLAAIHFG